MAICMQRKLAAAALVFCLSSIDGLCHFNAAQPWNNGLSHGMRIVG